MTSANTQAAETASDEDLLREIELLNQQIALLRSEINVLKAAAEFFYNEHLTKSHLG